MIVNRMHVNHTWHTQDIPYTYAHFCFYFRRRSINLSTTNINIKRIQFTQFRGKWRGLMVCEYAYSIGSTNFLDQKKKQTNKRKKMPRLSYFMFQPNYYRPFKSNAFSEYAFCLVSVLDSFLISSNFWLDYLYREAYLLLFDVTNIQSKWFNAIEWRRKSKRNFDYFFGLFLSNISDIFVAFVSFCLTRLNSLV